MSNHWGYKYRNLMEVNLNLFIIFFLFYSCQGKKLENELRPTMSNITESVYASVKVKPDNSYYAQSTQSGIIDKIYVEEGDMVKMNDILFLVQAKTSIRGQIAEAKINMDEANSKLSGQYNLLNNIQLEINASKDQLLLDSINLRRQERLYHQGIGKRMDFERLNLKYENAKNQLDVLKQKLAQTKITLQSNYKKAFNRLNNESDKLLDYKILSKADGIIYSINKEEGDFISSQERFAEIGSYNTFRIEMEVDEVDITKIELNDSILILLDAYPGDVFLASVSKIFPKKNELTQTFRVEGKFHELPSKLYYGLAGEANIVVSKRYNAMIIPTSYLLPNNKVLTLDGEKVVKLGIKNLEYVEILSGIDSSTILTKQGQ